MSRSDDGQKENSAPVMFVFAGPNGSGKSSINAQVLKNPALGFSGEYINADDIAKSMESQIPDYQTRNIKRTREQDKAEAFKNERPETAMQKYPDLAGAYAGVEAARRHVEKEQLSGEEAKVVMARINKNAHNSIERGHVPQVQVNERSQDRDLEKEAAAHRHREKEFGR